MSHQGAGRLRVVAAALIVVATACGPGSPPADDAVDDSGLAVMWSEPCEGDCPPSVRFGGSTYVVGCDAVVRAAIGVQVGAAVDDTPAEFHAAADAAHAIQGVPTTEMVAVGPIAPCEGAGADEYRLAVSSRAFASVVRIARCTGILVDRPADCP